MVECPQCLLLADARPEEHSFTVVAEVRAGGGAR